MKLESLRKLIREEVEQQLDEADKASKGPPKTFAEFRKRMATALKKAKAPPALTSEVGDVDNEGGGVVSALWSAWRNIEIELKDARSDAEKSEAWFDMVEYYVHDAVIDMLDGFNDPMNYAPGAKRGQKPVDAPVLAQAVVAAMTPKKKEPTADEKNARLLSDMLGLVTDTLDACSGVTNVQWERGNPEVRYDVVRSDYLEEIEDIAVNKAGLTPVGSGEEGSDTFVDDITGMTVKFGDGVATVNFK